MDCPHCGNHIDGGRQTCPWCGVLTSNIGTGVLATPGKRLGAYLLDALLVGIVVGISFLLTAGEQLIGLLIPVFFGVLAIVLYSKGMTPAKYLLKMRVYKTSGKPAGFLTMLFRETIGKFISGLVFSLGYLWLLWDPDKQAWHDKLVGTVVMMRSEPRLPAASRAV